MAWRDVLRSDLGTLVRGTPNDGHRHHSHLWPGPFYLRLHHWRRDLLIVTEQIAAIVNANAPMVRGLDAAAMDAPNGNVEAMLLTVRDDVAAGESLADAMAFRPRFFPPYYVDLIRAGERTGRLGESLLHASNIVRRMTELRTQRLQFWYPAMLVAIHVALGAFMIVKIYPVFAEMTVEMGGAEYLPRWMLAGIVYLEERYVFLLALILLVALAVAIGPRILRNRLAEIALLLPVWRGVVRKRILAQIVHVLGTMLRADVTLDRALAECAVLAVPRPYRQALSRVADRVEAGEAFADALDHHPRLFHRPFRDLIRLGERSGRLTEVLDRIATLYDVQTDKIQRIVVDYTLAASVVAVSVLTLGATLLIFGLNVTLMQAILEQL